METNNLKSIRQSRQLAVWGLAAKAKVSAATLSAVEKWGYVPREGVRGRIAKALGVTTEEIWPGDESHEEELPAAS